MADLQATWTPEGRLFFWSTTGRVSQAARQELPWLVSSGVAGHARRALATQGPPLRRRSVTGLEVEIRDALPVLAHLPLDASVSDSIHCWSLVARLGVEMAAGQRVAPTVEEGEARWKALLTRRADRERFEALARALPTASRALPTQARGSIRIPTRELALRGFLDRSIDTLYRSGAYPGHGRGWSLELAEALRGDDPAFTPRDARFQGIPELLAGWSSEAEASGLRLGMTLSLPDNGTGRFPLELWLHPTDRPELRVPIGEAWKIGSRLDLGGHQHAHAAHSALRGLARARRIFPPLQDSLDGSRPRSLQWTAREVWDFLSEGVEPLKGAGFAVEIPDAFSEAGTQRLRARLRVAASTGPDGRPALTDLLRFSWEVVLGDEVIEGTEFAALCAEGEPVVRFRDHWVLLDPAEIARLPAGLPQEGTLPTAVALRAVLVGEHDGVPVVADDQLQLVLAALRQPPNEPIPSALTGTLRPYQHRGFSWLTTLGHLGLGACLADDMGLGKTITAIAHLLRRRQTHDAPSLVVCPTSVLANWSHELSRFAPTLRAARYHGMSRSVSCFDDADVVLTTYGVLVRDQDLLGEVAWDVLVLDEAQAIKNPASQRARAARSLTAAHRIAMTGTPMENRLDELWSVLEFLLPGLLGPRATFRRTVAVPVERFGDKAVAASLRRAIAPFLLRRVKTDSTVISDLPDKLEKRVYCPLTAEQGALYRQVVDEFMDRIREATDIERRGQVLAMLTALKQVCNHPAQYLRQDGPLDGRSGKFDQTMRLLERIFERGEAVLVFTQYRQMGVRLKRHLESLYGEAVPFLHGGTTASRREEMVRAFQDDPDSPPVLLVSLRAGGTGLNLTRATHVLHYDRWWNPAVEDQATDRAYRIGQHDNVLVHKLVTPGTLEERIDELLEEKRALADQVVASGERWVTELDDDALRKLVTLGDDALMEAK